MAVASHPLLSGLPDSDLQRDDLGFDALPSLPCSPSASEVTGNTDGHGTSSEAISSHEMLSGFLDDNLQRADLGLDTLSSLHCSPEASSLKGNTDKLVSQEDENIIVQKEELRDGNVQPEETDPAQMNHSEAVELPDEENNQNGNAGRFSSGDRDRAARKDEEDDVTILEVVRCGKNTALPTRGFPTAGAAVRGEPQDGDVVLLSDSEGADSPQKEFCCADIPSAPGMDKKDREEVGDIVILEPTINKEVPASVCRESSSPRLFEEYTGKPDEPTVGDSVQVMTSPASTPTRQPAGREWRQSGVSAGNWRKLAVGKPLHQLTCSSCLKLFSSRYELIRHVFVHVDGVEPPLHVCVMCGQVFASDRELANHHESTGAQCYAFVPVVKVRVGTLDEVWVCSTCEQTFDTEHRLAVHKADRHLRTVISTRAEQPASGTKLGDLHRVRVDRNLGHCHSSKRKRKRDRSPGLSQWESFDINEKKKLGRPRTHLQESPHSNHKRKPDRPSRIFAEELPATQELTVREPLSIKNEINMGNPINERSKTVLREPLDKKSEISEGPPRRKLGRFPSDLNGEPVNINPKRKLGRPNIVCGDPLFSKAGITAEDPVPTVGGPIDLKSEILPGESEINSGEMPRRNPGKPRVKKSKRTPAETHHSLPQVAPAVFSDRVPEIKRKEPLNIKSEMSSEFSANRLLEITQVDSVNRTSEMPLGGILSSKPKMPPGEPVDRINEMVLREPLDRMSETAHGENLDRKPKIACGEICDRTTEMRPGEALDRLSTMATGISLSKFETATPENKSGIMSGEPVNSEPGITPNHLTDSKPKRKRGRPPGSKNKGPSKPRAKKPKIVSGELLNRMPEMAVEKSLHTLQEVTPGIKLEILDDMRSGTPPDTGYEMRPGECFYDLIPGELTDRQHVLTLGEHLYGLHEMAPQEQLYRLHEMTPGMPLGSNLDVMSRESTDRRHETTQAEPLYRLHEMTTVESVHRLNEMSPVEILYRKHESTPESPLDRIHKIATAEPLSRLHEMTPVYIHFRNNESKSQDTVPKLSSVEPFGRLCESPHRLSEMAPREPLHKVTELAPVEALHIPAEPLHRLSEMPPGELLHRLSEIPPRDPLHTLFEMATGDPFQSLFEMGPEEPYSSLSKMAPEEPYGRLSDMALGKTPDRKSEIAPENFVNGMPKKKRGRPPGSKNKNPGKPRSRKSKAASGEPLCTKPETNSGEPRDKISEVSSGDLSCGVTAVLLGESGDKKPNKNSGETEKWPCHFCRQLFCSVSGLKRHLVRHTGERNYVCDICGKSFARSDNLRVHKYTHAGGLPYKCDVCGKAFGWACHLRDHKRKHSVEAS